MIGTRCLCGLRFAEYSVSTEHQFCTLTVQLEFMCKTASRYARGNLASAKVQVIVAGIGWQAQGSGTTSLHRTGANGKGSNTLPRACPVLERLEAGLATPRLNALNCLSNRN